MADVAAAAGVSSQTVSRVVNDRTSVSPTTRSRVEEAIEKLGYRPNPAAQVLAGNRSGIIGVVAADYRFDWYSRTIAAIDRTARERGYSTSQVVLESVGRSGFIEAFDRLRLQSVDGIVLITAHEIAMKSVRQVGIEAPMVVVQGDDTSPWAGICVDSEGGAEAVTRHLLEQGATTVAHVAGLDGWIDTTRRIAGWRRALEAASVAVVEPVEGDWSAESGYLAGRELADRRDVDGIFVANDQMALGVLRALNERGRRVPDDVLLAGFDDMPQSAYYSPPLTTVRHDFDEVGSWTIELLTGLIDGGPGTPSTMQIAPELVVRDSTRRP